VSGAEGPLVAKIWIWTWAVCCQHLAALQVHPLHVNSRRPLLTFRWSQHVPELWLISKKRHELVRCNVAWTCLSTSAIFLEVKGIAIPWTVTLAKKDMYPARPVAGSSDYELCSSRFTDERCSRVIFRIGVQIPQVQCFNALVPPCWIKLRIEAVAGALPVCWRCLTESRSGGGFYLGVAPPFIRPLSEAGRLAILYI